MKIGKARFVYEVEFELDLDFYFQTAHVFTISKEQYSENYPTPILDNVEIDNRDNVYCYLIIDSTFNLEEYDSVTEGSAKTRPQLLIIQGILAFLTNKAFLTTYCINIQHCITNQHIIENATEIIFSVSEKNLQNDLTSLLKTIKNSNESKKILIYTLLERFRKALHFEELSTENLVYIDESVLAYIHILEVLSDEFKHNLEIDLKEERNKLITEIITEAKACNDSIPTKKLKSLINILNTNQISLKSKVIQMLKELSVYNEKTDSIVSRFIEHRNSIAHGRKNLYQDVVVFPLKPFFSFIKDIYEQPIAIKLLASVSFSKYAKLKVWQKEWKEYLLHYELPTISMVKMFIQDKTYENIPNKEFLSGKKNGITPMVLTYYYIKGKIKFKELELILSNIIISSRKTENICYNLFDSCLILSDSTDKSLAKNAQKVVKTAYQNRTFPYSNIRDSIKELNYNDISVQWFEKWLNNEKK
ncbi:HEPN domain-containing protein [Flavobacterium seoulense]|uniref:Apea-like HEPN domain-containing protein n=1 Tax=Flavobacterium seoulense TaxID=1492738 RepID=A0A066WP98_9FLAO|nr:HEPN domain-containing protein [Flavobacterium seoulense]KDN55852.1 hypothetical protein FEM21_10430 [Flavobacterium seoulense]